MTAAMVVNQACYQPWYHQPINHGGLGSCTWWPLLARYASIIAACSCTSAKADPSIPMLAWVLPCMGQGEAGHGAAHSLVRAVHGTVMAATVCAGCGTSCVGMNNTGRGSEGREKAGLSVCMGMGAMCGQYSTGLCCYSTVWDGKRTCPLMVFSSATAF